MLLASAVNQNHPPSRTKIYVLSLSCGLATVLLLWFLICSILRWYFVFNFVALKFLPQVDECTLNWIITFRGALIFDMSTLAASEANAIVVGQCAECIDGVNDKTLVLGDLELLSQKIRLGNFLPNS